MGQRIASKFFILCVSIIIGAAGQTSLVYRHDSSNIYIILDTNDLNTKKFNLIREDWSFNISNFEDSNLDVSLSHTPSVGAIVSQINLYKLNISECKVAKNLKFRDWLLLKETCDQDSTNCYLIFQDDINRSERFVYGYTIDAYEVKIRTGSTE